MLTPRIYLEGVSWIIALPVLFFAGCAGPSAMSSAYDGRYAGPFYLSAAASADICPASSTGQAVMTVQGGQAHVDVSQTTYFSGHVGNDGDLILMSGQGLAATIHGRIVNGVYVASGSGNCQYQVHLTRVASGTSGS